MYGDFRFVTHASPRTVYWLLIRDILAANYLLVSERPGRLAVEGIRSDN